MATSTEAIRLRGVAGATYLRSTTPYITINTWYRTKLTRTQLGSVSLYIKGGAFGNNWVLVSVIGGIGTNPVINASYSTNCYLVLDLDVGDRATNFLMKKGIEV
jgi:hypothetical protein